MPTLTALAPRSSRNAAPSAVATLPAISSTSPNRLRNCGDRALHDDRMAVRDVDDEHVDARASPVRRRVRDSRRWRQSPRRPAAGPARRAWQTAAAAASQMSRAVIRPSSVPPSSTSGSFLIFRSTISRSASSSDSGASWTTSCADRRHARRRPWRRAGCTKRRSRSVSRPSASGLVHDDERADARAAISARGVRQRRSGATCRDRRSRHAACA